MNVFSVFQTATATMKRIEIDGAGDESVADSFTVDIDPVFGWTRIHTSENEEITGRSTVITADDLQTKFDTTHRKWKLEYDGHEYQVKSPVPFYTTGTDNLEHIEITLI